MALTSSLLLLAALAQPLTLATYAYPRYDRAAALAPLGTFLEKTLDRPVATRLYPTPDALADAIARGEVDIAMTNLAAYLRVGQRSEVRAIAVLDVPPATLDGYRGVLLARRAAKVASLADIRARATTLRYSEVLPGSTSGALVQANALGVAAGRAVRFAATRQVGTHDAALDDLLAGRSDVAALAEEPWRKLQRERPAEAASLVEIWRSEPLPPGPVVCVARAALDCGNVARLLTTRRDARAPAAALAAGWAETLGAAAFVPVDAARYAPFVRPSER